MPHPRGVHTVCPSPGLQGITVSMPWRTDVSLGLLRSVRLLVPKATKFLELLGLIFMAFQYHTLWWGLSAVTSTAVREPAAPPSPWVLETRKPETVPVRTVSADWTGFSISWFLGRVLGRWGCWRSDFYIRKVLIYPLHKQIQNPWGWLTLPNSLLVFLTHILGGGELPRAGGQEDGWCEILPAKWVWFALFAFFSFGPRANFGGWFVLKIPLDKSVTSVDSLITQECTVKTTLNLISSPLSDQKKNLVLQGEVISLKM